MALNYMEIVNKLCAEQGVQIIILFGSQAKKSATKQSDTDIAILGKRPLTLEEKISLTEGIANAYGFSEDSIDLVDMAHASPLLQHATASTGKLLWGSTTAYGMFILHAWRHYLDTTKLRTMRETILRESMPCP